MTSKYIYVGDSRYCRSRYMEANRVLYSFCEVNGTKLYKKVRDIS